MRQLAKAKPYICKRGMAALDMLSFPVMICRFVRRIADGEPVLEDVYYVSFL